MNNSSGFSRRSRRLNGKRNFKSDNAKTPAPTTITTTTTRRADERDGPARRYRAMDLREVGRITAEPPIVGHPGRDRGP